MKKIPEKNQDLRRYSLGRRLRGPLLYALWMIFWIAGTFAYNSGHGTYGLDRSVVGWRMIALFAVAALLGFFLFRIPRLISQRGGEGTIEKTGLKHTYESSFDPGAANRVNYEERLSTYLLIRTPNGKLRRVRFEQKPGFYLYYYPGTFVRVLPGLPYPIADPARTVRPPRSVSVYRDPEEEPADDLSHGVLCAACGRFNKPGTEQCVACGMTLIDPRDLFEP